MKCEKTFISHTALRQHESKHGYVDAVYEEFSNTRRCPFCKATFQLPVSMDSAVRKKNRFQGLTTHLRLTIHYKCQNAYKDWRKSLYNISPEARLSDPPDIPSVDRCQHIQFVSQQWRDYYSTKARLNIYKVTQPVFEPFDPCPPCVKKKT